MELKIDWLNPCNICDSHELTVNTTKGNYSYLYDGDEVKCNCGQIGEIDTDGECAWVNWNEEYND